MGELSDETRPKKENKLTRGGGTRRWFTLYGFKADVLATQVAEIGPNWLRDDILQRNTVITPAILTVLCG